MGGVGKTILTAAVVRDERVRGAFERIAWIGMSQQPDLVELQKRCARGCFCIMNRPKVDICLCRLYQQIHPDNDEMPTKANSIESQVTELRKICKQSIVLICLDDLCE
jgi:hypothetical protein